MDDVKKTARLKALEAVISQMDEDEMTERLPQEEEAPMVEEEAMEAESGPMQLSPEEIERLRALLE